ncbi:hypothetical protein JTE90_013982 [Oedothorax gibbosus]|uniref:Uncharacterized protein n=1 Tax=Oedothorax gibbosus TaxID=931172 RepID=A0AAV6UBY5_9ARAC|nr:hypothetical protein JTE90_013982 [Oedothorax gibbosus]
MLMLNLPPLRTTTPLDDKSSADAGGEDAEDLLSVVVDHDWVSVPLLSSTVRTLAFLDLDSCRDGVTIYFKCDQGLIRNNICLIYQASLIRAFREVSFSRSTQSVYI